MKKITDLEQFALEQIWRPYSKTAGLPSRPETLPVDLMETTARLSQKSDWSDRVLGRLAGLGFWFPSYIQHPLVEFLRAQKERED